MARASPVEAVDTRRVAGGPAHQAPKTGLAGPTLAAGAVVLAGAAAVWLWAIWAMVDDTASACGQVVAAAPHHVLTHPVGGVVLEILVSEGDQVRSGDVLLRFGPAAAQQERADLEGRQLAAVAALARLEAERQGRAEISFPDDLLAAMVAPPLMRAEATLFNQRRRDREARIALIEHRIEEYRTEISGIRDAQEGALKELTLLDPGLEAAKAPLEGAIGQMSAEAARVQQRIADAGLEILRVREAWRERLAREIESARRTEVAVADRLRAQATIAWRRSLVAPRDGLVASLRYRRVGDHILPSHPILDLRPPDAAIVVVALFSRWDAEALIDGAEARVHLDASGPIVFPQLRGTVRIGARAPNRSGPDGLRAFVALGVADLSSRQQAAITAGLEALVSVATPPRSAFQSLMRPLAPLVDQWLLI